MNNFNCGITYTENAIKTHKKKRVDKILTTGKARMIGMQGLMLLSLLCVSPKFLIIKSFFKSKNGDIQKNAIL